MRIESVHNYNMNKTNIPKFKGKVSPEFSQYVNELRKDCLKPVYKQNPAEINNMCDSIISLAKDVMEKCFHSQSVLSIDTKLNKEADALIISNSLAVKYTSNPYSGIGGYVSKKERLSPIERLAQLRMWIMGDSKHYSAFLEAFSYNILGLKYIVEILENCAGGNCNKEEILKLVQNLPNESEPGNVDNHLINMLKGCGNYQGGLKDIHDLLEFDEAHINILAKYYDYKPWKIFMNQFVPELKQQVESLMNSSK